MHISLSPSYSLQIENRQTMLFSATFPDEVHKWANEWMKKEHT